MFRVVLLASLASGSTIGAKIIRWVILALVFYYIMSC